MQRVQYNEDLDFLKGIGIVFVVLGHCFTSAIVEKYPTIEMCKLIIYTFHMPLFFIVSGYLQGLKPYKLKKLKKISLHQTRKLLLPYLVWSILLYVFYFFINKLSVGTIPEDITLNPFKLLLNIFTYKVVTGNVLWFVYILFLISVVSYFIHCLISRKSVSVMFVILVAAIGFIANSYMQEDLFIIKRFAVMWIYYEIGVFIGKYVKDVSFKASWYLNLGFAALYVLLFIGFVNIGGTCGMILNILCALTAVFIFYSLSKYNNSWAYRILSYIGKRTLYIYYLHNPYIVLILITALTSFTEINVIFTITISFALGCIIPLIIGEIVLNRIKGVNVIFFGKEQLNYDRTKM